MSRTESAPAEFHLDAAGKRVFIGLMVGMFVASVSQTIVGPAMPQIVAQLGGMEHYSWIATAAMLVSAVTVPVVGKLSDLYGRRTFYILGLIVFMVGSIICGLSVNFWMLIVGRAVQGLGMGTLMPLSQTIIGDIIPPRQRGKYQGIMGSVFGFTSIAGPLAGGAITDALNWRWLFFVTLPFGAVALYVIGRFLHLPHTPRKAKIDYPGIATMTVALVCLLVATSFGGSTFAWSSWQTITLYVVGVIFLAIFLFIESRAEEPVVPLRLFRSSIFTLANIASFCVAIMMFGAIIYIPVYAQGVLGVNATQSGLILTPLMLGMILVGLLVGLLITKTGHYKGFVLAGVTLMGVGYFLITLLGADSSPLQLSLAIAVLGIGLGACLQQYTLIVQNNAHRSDLGIATATNQFFRNVGSTVGVAIFGSIMTASLPGAIAKHLPPEYQGQALPNVSAGSVLDHNTLTQLPPALAGAIRNGLADALHTTFLVALPIALVALVATIFIKPLPLRDTVNSGEEAGREMLDTLGQTAPDPDAVPALGRDVPYTRTKERLLGVQLLTLSERATEDHPLLRRAVADLADGDVEEGRTLLRRTARMLLSEDEDVVTDQEKYALEVAAAGRRKGGVLSPQLRADLATMSAQCEPEKVLSEVEPTLHERVDGLDISGLHSVNEELATAFLTDLNQRVRERTAKPS
ncbi:MDR family MFS transporter [Granulicoccus phenolivorans]|uniref:MDR family MFS transporter n=1 Tax=Granulicoccus phenolivorans TaxID=266854 RepID=UPI00041E1123|nr:MDR family MFS transporter [Granulicoccus phenolivorans]